VIAGPVRISSSKLTDDQGLIAAALGGFLAVAATIGRIVLDGPRPLLLWAGLLLPVAFLGAAAVLERRTGTTCRFTLRTTTGATVPYTLRGRIPPEALRTGDLVRVVTGRAGAVRAAEVLATMNGLVIRRVAARAGVAPAWWAAAAQAVLTVGIAIGAR
jgi:hypothetical protein